jgi:hypothetical protein
MFNHNSPQVQEPGTSLRHSLLTLLKSLHGELEEEEVQEHLSSLYPVEELEEEVVRVHEWYSEHLTLEIRLRSLSVREDSLEHLAQLAQREETEASEVTLHLIQQKLSQEVVEVAVEVQSLVQLVEVVEVADVQRQEQQERQPSG